MGKELQADCYAGMFAGFLLDTGQLAKGDVAEARRMTRYLGDPDVLSPDEPGAHGNGKLRLFWMNPGLATYLEEGMLEAMAACDTVYDVLYAE